MSQILHTSVTLQEEWSFPSGIQSELFTTDFEVELSILTFMK